MSAFLQVVGQASPDDLSGLRALVESEQLDPKRIVAFLNKTEGNGCVNDFARGYCAHVLHEYLSGELGPEAAEKALLIMSGGCEGVLSPHMNVFSQDGPESDQVTGGLAIGAGKTRDFKAEEIGRMAMVEETARLATELMESLSLSKEDVHFVQIKCPLIRSSDVTEAQEKGVSLATTDTLKSMGYSRGASSLGAAVALGEVELSGLDDSKILGALDLYSGVASSSSGIELRCCEVLIMGNSPLSRSPLRIGHAVMQDALDRDAVVQACVESQGMTDGNFDPEKVANVFAKSEVDPSGMIRGKRHTMLQDSDVSGTRMSRAVVGAIVASVLGRTQVYVSGGAEHQGPPGGGPVAAISWI
ncbi:ring-opening amidohydrolase [Pelagicoccus albus]|uniref:Cyanuric acid amidohydrolase n=1 Tax=Pelagicoccus albus TaxID=415222 RepID=A0A7X1B8Y1_9BACT|nr:ring-opening amidohydrolase [Pelagicoccus albus]MBC2607887.1 ring-opening amidohydrolase [Pelagicoccus albus]